MKTYSVLYADNDTAALKIISEYLTKLGYAVEVTDSVVSTREILRKRVFDLIILDLRLNDNEDIHDKSGLEIAKTEARNTPKLIYTAFPQVADAKEVLLADKHELPPAVDFLDKTTGLAGLKEAIEVTISKYIRTSKDLLLMWSPNGICSIGQLATLLDPNQEIADFAELTNELTVIIYQIFAHYEQVSFSRLLWAEKSRCCLVVHAYQRDIEDQYLMTIGTRDAIYKEIELFRNTVSQTRSSNLPTLHHQKSSLHMAAILWSIKGLDLDRTKTLTALTKNGTERQIQNVIMKFFAANKTIWYQQGIRKIAKNVSAAKTFAEYLGVNLSTINKQALQKKFETIADISYSHNIFPVRISSKQVVIDRPGGQIEYLPNPLNLLFDTQSFPPTEIVTSVISGLASFDKVIVDENEQTWNTDYSRIRTAFIATDFAALENFVRFSLTDLTDVFSYLDFEEQLLGMKTLAENLSIRNVIPSHRTLLAAILSIRNSAARIIGDHLTAYYLALLFMSAKSFIDISFDFRLSRLETIAYIYQLLFMAKISQFIIEGREDKSANKTISNATKPKILINEQQRRVWIDESEKYLSHTEFDILLFLYRKKGAVCSREEILEQVLRYSGGLDKSAKNLINTHINRIRGQIESNPEKPALLLTVRNEGYRLDILNPQID